MNFPEYNLVYEPISSSYHHLIQHQIVSGSIVYFLDGWGNVVSFIPSSSVGQLIITQDQTASWAVKSETSSYSNFSLISSVSDVSIISETSSVSYISETATSASWASRSLSAVSASWAPDGVDGTSLETGSTYPFTSSWSEHALTASYINILPSGSTESSSYSESSSFAITADHVRNNGLSIPTYDYSEITYNGPLGNVDECIYRNGGVSGSIVCVVTLLYTGDIFTGVSKSFG